MTPNTPQAGRVATLDALRLLAALVVVLYHFGFRGAVGGDYTTIAFPTLAPVAVYGYLGVSLFFMISGFVIAWSMEGRTAYAFARARLLRLYPGYVVCMTLTALVMAMVNTPPFTVTPLQWFANLTMVSPVLNQPFVDGVYWSIVLEITFYVWMAVLMAARIMPRHLVMVCAVWLIIAAADRLVLHSGALKFALITEQAPLFIFGMLSYQTMIKRASFLAVLVLVASAILATAHSNGQLAWIRDNLGTRLDYGIIAVIHLAMFIVFLSAIWLRNIVPSTPVLILAGGITYPLYLLHENIGFIAINALAPLIGETPALIATIIGEIGLAGLVYTSVEPPGRRLLAALIDGAVERVGLAGKPAIKPLSAPPA